MRSRVAALPGLRHDGVEPTGGSHRDQPSLAADRSQTGPDRARASLLGGGAQRGHADHSLWIVLHALTGFLTLVSGFLALYMGWTRAAFDYHRHTGCAGMTMAFVALFLAISDPHRNPASGWATGTLAVVWLIATSMGWWRGSQKRWRVHQMWMIRSMVLTWTFVFCRLAQRLGDMDGIAPAFGIWAYWVGPLLIAEIALQLWNRRSPAR